MNAPEPNRTAFHEVLISLAELVNAIPPYRDPPTAVNHGACDSWWNESAQDRIWNSTVEKSCQIPLGPFTVTT